MATKTLDLLAGFLQRRWRAHFTTQRIGEYESLNKHHVGHLSQSSESLTLWVNCSNGSPRGILIRLMEDLCLGLLLAPLFRAASFC